MKARSGQAVVYLVLVLVALTILVLMNVSVYLGVSARNTTMNGGDAAALAVARYQGELLNRIGAWNVEHLKAALKGDSALCESIALRQLRCCFLDPLEGLARGNEFAKKNDCERNDLMLEILRQHVSDIRAYYIDNPELYPEPWPGAWAEYAHNLEIVLSEGIWAGPDNIDFVDGATGHFLLDKFFYEAIAGRNWCWFLFHAPGLLSAYTTFQDWGPLPGRDLDSRRRKCVNSEIYSLCLDRRVGRAVDLLGVDLIRRLTGASEKDISESPLLNDPNQAWFFFDSDVWRKWWEVDPIGPESFPAMGSVRPEYDVRGCAAICRVTRRFSNLVQEGDVREAVWSAAAKPFGVVASDQRGVSLVTSLKGFVTDAFDSVRLVPLDGVGGCDLSTADPVWMNHVRLHLNDYLENGPRKGSSCWYCQMLNLWESSPFRASGDRWLRYHSHECVRPSGSGSGRGGSAHGH